MAFHARNFRRCSENSLIIFRGIFKIKGCIIDKSLRICCKTPKANLFKKHSNYEFVIGKESSCACFA